MLIAVIALVIGAALYVMNMVGVNINANVICSLGVLIVGFAMLIKGADLFVEGASKIAAKFKNSADSNRSYDSGDGYFCT